MPLVCGPKNSRMTYTGTPCPHTDLAFHTEHLSLLAAIKEYEKVFNVLIIRHVDEADSEVKYGDKYFKHIDNDTGYSQLVDLHIIREADVICPKQNLDVQLQSNDIIELGELIC